MGTAPYAFVKIDSKKRTPSESRDVLYTQKSLQYSLCVNPSNS